MARMAHVCLYLCLSCLRYSADARFSIPDGSKGFVLWRSTLSGSEVVEGPREKVCEVCGEAVDEVAKFLSDPGTVDDVAAYVEASLCVGLPPDLLQRCAEMVTEYVSQTFALLTALVNRDTLCVHTRICPVVAQLALAVTQNPRALAALEVGAVQVAPKCDACVAALSDALALIADSKNQKAALERLHLACQRLNNPVLQGKCDDLVEAYFPQLVAILGSLTPQEVCTRIKLCPPPPQRWWAVWEHLGGALPDIAEKSAAVEVLTTPLVPERAHQAGEAVQIASSTCDACVSSVKKVVEALQDGEREEKALEMFKQVCDRVGFEYLRNKCRDVAEQYFPQLVASLESLTPEQACAHLWLCSAPAALDSGGRAVGLGGTRSRAALERSEDATAVATMTTPQECVACRFLVAQLKKRLQDPENQVKLAVVLTDLCNKIGKYAEQCKAAVAEYLPEFLSDLDHYVDPQQLCQGAKLCGAALPTGAAVHPLLPHGGVAHL